jgi:1-acyl-sn-glycerol-3-phosphate acyltransferase
MENVEMTVTAGDVTSTNIASSLLRLRRAILRTLGKGAFRLLTRVTVTGLDNIPKSGAYIITHNHITLFDAPMVVVFWPVQVEALAGADVFHRPGQGLLTRFYGAIPVHRGEYDRKVIETAIEILQANRPLSIAPEGGRSRVPGLRKAHPGVAYFIDMVKVPVLPLGLVGVPNDLLQRAFRWEQPELEIRIGKSILLPPIEGRGADRRESRQRNADLVMRHIAGLLPETYHGHYAGEAIYPNDVSDLGDN